MSLRIGQIYIQSESLPNVEKAILDCCRKIRTKFIPHQKYQLEGVRQALKCIIKTKRRYYVCPPKDGWICMWEVIKYGATLADPGITCCLSHTLHSKSLWLNLNQDCNTWAYQLFEKGRLKEELFLPEDYFLGNIASGNLNSYGSCLEFATIFKNKMNLPYFLLTIPQLERKKKLLDSVVKIIARV